MKKRILPVLVVLLTVCLIFSGCHAGFELIDVKPSAAPSQDDTTQNSVSIDEIPPFSGEAYITINDNVPHFTAEELTTESYEFYSELDKLDRCGVAEACVGIDLMPTEERGNIGQVKPSGWQTVKYDIVDGKYLYNRCHLIGYQLSGENANAGNLITGTRFLNMEGMLPFENMVADYVKETGNHCMYRVTPVFEGDNLVALGVQIEGFSVEDNGEGISFNVYCYNNQPGITINYANGDSCLATPEATEAPDDGKIESFVLNTGTKKFHVPDCSSVADIKDLNKENYEGSREELINQGYEACGRCKP